VACAKGEPADVLQQSWDIQCHAAALGFDWPDVSGVLSKAHEELGEIESALNRGDSKNVIEEVGDLLFAAVNLARFLNADPAEALRKANQRFRRRFALLQEELRTQSRAMAECTLAELDDVWEQVKSMENGS